MKKWKRNISKVLAVILCLGSMNFTTVSAQESTTVLSTNDICQNGTLDGNDGNTWDGVTMEDVYEKDNYNVCFRLTNTWSGGYRAEITIENTGDEDIKSWYLKVPFKGEISSIWNASVCQKKDDEIIFKNVGWNQKIPTGSSVSFGVCVDRDFDEFPKKYEVIGEIKEIATENYIVEYQVESTWEKGFSGGISITNVSDKIMEDWILTFDFARDIEEIWCAELLLNEDGHYVIQNNGYNANIEVGQTIYFGFTGTGGANEDVPLRYCLSSYDWEGETEENSDTDGDGLTDYEENNLTWTDPFTVDTDEDGIVDGEEDIDGDFIQNKNEIVYGTDPVSSDTDKDNLTDYEELYTYFTDPLKIDTDEDGMSDYDEVCLELNPLLADSDGDGIVDTDEKQEQTFEEVFEESEGNALTKVSVSLNISGNVQNNVHVLNTYGVDMLSSNVVGLVGVPIDITVDVEFDEAELVFHYDETALGNVKEENLAVMWYDEENNWYHILDDESVVDTENNTVTYVTTHFSTYMLVDSAAWYDAWRENIDYRNNPSGSEKQYYDIVFVTDVSYSMEGERLATAKEAIRRFVASLQVKDEAAIIKFCQDAYVTCDFTNASQDLYEGISKLYLGSGTNVNSGLVRALTLFENRESQNKKIVVLICDGDVYYVQSTIDSYIEQGIEIHAVNIANQSSNAYLERMAELTGGQYYYGDNAESIETNFGLIQDDTVDSWDTTDTDGDGLYDVFETRGIRLENGQVIYTNPNLQDSDGDTLSDFEETGLPYNIDERYNDERIAHRVKYFVLRSDPTKKDTDGDTLPDSSDEYPWDKKREWIADLESKYLQIERTGGTLFTGGNQSWWADKASSTATKNFDDFSSDKYYRLMKMGCGAIAMNDMELYLAKNNSWSNSVISSSDGNGVIPEENYRNYVEKNFDSVYCVPGDIVHYNTGLQPGDMEKGLGNYLAKNNSVYNSVQWAPYNNYASKIEKQLVIEEIEIMLKKEIPVVFCYYTSNEDDKLKIFNSLNSAKNNDSDAKNYQKVKSHYMTVIGLYRSLNEAECEYEYILKVVSWGEIYYVRYDEYANNINYFTNILRVS